MYYGYINVLECICKWYWMAFMSFYVFFLHVFLFLLIVYLYEFGLILMMEYGIWSGNEYRIRRWVSMAIECCFQCRNRCCNSTAGIKTKLYNFKDFTEYGFYERICLVELDTKMWNLDSIRI